MQIKDIYGQIIWENVQIESLQGANLSGQILRRADLSGADLSGANLRSASLWKVRLSGAILSGAKLENVSLWDADLRGADLRGANLRGACLSGAKLSGADLSRANLQGADLSGAKISGAKLPEFQIPQRKSLVAWKKLCEGKIAKLRIPCRSPRTASPIGNKCRAERAYVEEIWDKFGDASRHGESMYIPSFKYEVGKYVSVPDFDPDIRIECAPGIHFFMTREEAEEYIY